MSLPAQTRVIAGLDEAGLGPLLGPMTIGWSAFRVPRGDLSLWKVLGEIVSDAAKDDGDKLIVADSKKVYSRTARGAKRLEMTALAFLDQCAGCHPRPRRPADLLALPPEALRLDSTALSRHPWYAKLPDPLPHHVDAGRLEIRSERLNQVMHSAHTEMVSGGLCTLPAGELNLSWSRTRNKSLSQWQVNGALIEDLMDRFGDENLSVFVDRMGGRQHYGSWLRQQFPKAQVEVRNEQSDVAEYVVCRDFNGAEQRVRVVFAERCEERSFCVALASCFAKYGRELAMHAFNTFFGEFQPDLKPTAGYTTDGRRWLADAQPAMSLAGIEQGVLVRDR